MGNDDVGRALIEGLRREGVDATAIAVCRDFTSPTSVILVENGRFALDQPDDERAVLATEGDLAIDGQKLDLFTLYVLAPGASPLLSGTGRAMLLGGQAFSTPRHVWWNFVSSSRERINQAKDDWKAGRFPLVPGDEDEFIPIPAVPKTVSYP